MKKYPKNKEIFIWCCELSLNSGEGKLAVSYILDIKKNLNKKIVLRTPELFDDEFDINNYIKNNNKYKTQSSKWVFFFAGYTFLKIKNVVI